MERHADELRAIVREAVERHLGRPASIPAAIAAGVPRAHASHGMLPVAEGSAAFDGRCLIEPAVACNHCGYCRSFGH